MWPRRKTPVAEDPVRRELANLHAILSNDFDFADDVAIEFRKVLGGHPIQDCTDRKIVVSAAGEAYALPI